MRRLHPGVLTLSLCAVAAVGTAEANPRAFVASFGSDANTATSCGLANPCRNFAAAMGVVNDGGEVVALDAAGYGAVTITKSVTISANAGAYAGVAAATGDAITIAGTGINVTLRGLSINGTGGIHGVVMTSGAILSIENCVISNFSSTTGGSGPFIPGGSGVFVDTAATVRIVDSLIRDSYDGVILENGATATISRSRIFGNTNVGIHVIGSAPGTTTTAAISDSVFSNPNVGVFVVSPAAGATALGSVIRSTLSNNGIAAAVNTTVGTAVLTLSESMVTGNGNFGLFQSGSGVLESLGNNTVRQNGPNFGAITPVSPM